MTRSQPFLAASFASSIVLPPYSLSNVSTFQPAPYNTAITSVNCATFCPVLGLITKDAFLQCIKNSLVRNIYICLCYHEHERAFSRVSNLAKRRNYRTCHNRNRAEAANDTTSALPEGKENGTGKVTTGVSMPLLPVLYGPR